jgi:uncharacterized membrane protein
MSLPAQLTLAAGDSGSMQLRVDIPLNAPRGTIYPFSIKVSSTGDSELYKTSPAALEVNYRMLFLPSATRP